MKARLIIVCMLTINGVKGQTNNKAWSDSVLFDLGNYQTSTDTVNAISTRYCKGLGLREENDGKTRVFYCQGQKVFSGKAKGYHHLLQVYAKSYLFISFVKGVSFAAGPETFERDSIFILDLKSRVLKFVSLHKVYLNIAKPSLFGRSFRKDFPENRPGSVLYAAIEKIDFANNSLLLVDDYGRQKECRLADVAVPYNCCSVQ